MSYAAGLWISLSIGAHVNRYAFRAPAGIADPGTLRRIHVARRSSSGTYDLAPVISYAELRAIQRASAPTLVEAYSPSEGYVSAPGRGAHGVALALASHGFLRLLQAPLALGRHFDANDPRTGETNVALISDRLWEKAYDRSRSVIGSTLRVNGVSVHIVGVLSPRFSGVDHAIVDVWLPLGSPASAHADPIGTYHLSAVARLYATESEELVKRNIERALASATGSATPAVQMGPMSRSRFGTNDAGHVVVVALAVALCVLALALANCLLCALAYTHGSRRAWITMAALGAAPAVLYRRLVIRLGALAWALALPAVFAVDLSRSIFAQSSLHSMPAMVDLPLVMWAVALTCLLCGLLYGCAWRVLGASLHTPTERRHEEPSSTGFRKALVGCYVAGVAAITVTAAPLWQAYVTARNTSPGFNTSGAIVSTVSFLDKRTAHIIALRASNALRTLPFAVAVGASTSLPYRRTISRSISHGEAHPTESFSIVYHVNGDFFQALGLPFSRGSAPTASLPELAVNRALADRFAPGEIVGRCVRIDSYACTTVTGIVANADAVHLGERPQPAVFLPLRADHRSESLFFVIRTRSLPTHAMLQGVQELLERLYADGSVRTEPLSALVAQQVRPLRTVAGILGALCAVAAALAVFGIQACVSYTLEQRRVQMGVRAALGATPLRQAKEVGAELLLPVVLGLGFGLWLGLVATAALGAVVRGLPPVLPEQIAAGVGMPLLLLGLGLLPAARLIVAEPAVLMRQ